MKKLSFFIFNCLFTFLAQANEIPESEPLKVHSTLSLNQIDSARTSPTKNQKLWLTANIAKLLPSVILFIPLTCAALDELDKPDYFRNQEIIYGTVIRYITFTNHVVNIVMDYKSLNQTRSLKREKKLLVKDSIITALSFINEIHLAKESSRNFFKAIPMYTHLFLFHLLPFTLLTAYSAWDAFKRVKIITEKPKNIPLKLDLPSVRVKNL